ncbi:hypothetical protein HRJ81_06235 [Bordetella pertussis]|nr:hypothetical protein HRK00_13105 [Bordetella pertussis]ULZ05828.1 hypothetical protein HRJ81_06235 [Bordetella pertussis]
MSMPASASSVSANKSAIHSKKNGLHAQPTVLPGPGRALLTAPLAEPKPKIATQNILQKSAALARGPLVAACSFQVPLARRPPGWPALQKANPAHLRLTRQMASITAITRQSVHNVHSKAAARNAVLHAHCPANALRAMKTVDFTR